MTKTVSILFAAALTLSACAQPEPEPVNMQPTFDKAGNAYCMDGYTLGTADSGEPVCMPN